MDYILAGLLLALIALVLFMLSRQGQSQGEQKVKLALLEQSLGATERLLREAFGALREEITINSRYNREELSLTLKSVGDSLSRQMAEMAMLQKVQLDSLTSVSEQKLELVRATVESKLKELQSDNTQKLESIRATVDEKLHQTLEKRLGESFKLVSDRLEQVHRGLGEMQSLATGVGDLKKALVNVKTRGTLGEVQLCNILEQILAPEQYEKNVAVRPGAGERVEYAVKMPGKDERVIWLPLDSKFPVEDYYRLLDAYEAADTAMVETCAKHLEAGIKKCAKDIREKYVEPPHTTDFGIMFLPFEGLYAEVLRRNGLFETLMKDYKVAVTGPTTLAAFLNSLQMGFRTLTIEKRSSEVWALLSAVKTEFGRFGAILEKTQKKLQEASNTIEDATRKSKTIERKLKDVQQLPELELQLPDMVNEETAS